MLILSRFSAGLLRSSQMFILGLFLVSCADPTSSVQTIDDRPQLAVQGAPAGSRLLVNGIDVGAANDFNGKNAVLRLEKGIQSVVVQLDGTAVHNEQVFLSDDVLRVIRVAP